MRLLAVSLFLFIAVGGTGVALDHQRDREARAGAALVAADTALKRAQENPGTAMTSVAEAEAAVAEARDAGATGDALCAGSRSWRACVTTCGASCGWPTSCGWAHFRPRPAKGRCTWPLLARRFISRQGVSTSSIPSREDSLPCWRDGDAVGGGSAGDIRHVSIDGGHVVASDGAATYVRDELGRWQRRPLAVAEVDGLRPDAPVSPGATRRMVFPGTET